MKIIKLPTDIHPGYIFQAQELVDDALGKNTFLKQVWQTNIHAWVVTKQQKPMPYDPPGCLYPHELAGYCSVAIEGDVGILKTCVVGPLFEKRGIATELTKHRINFLKENKVKSIRSNAWFVNGYCPAQKHLMRNGLKPIKDIRGFYQKEHNDKFPCIQCGPCCKCVARIFELKL